MESSSRSNGLLAEVRFESRGAVGLVTLDRRKALNALTHAMCIAIDDQLAEWAKHADIAVVVIRSGDDRAFCAGGDVRSLYDCGIALKRGLPEGRVAREFIRDEYRMNRHIKIYPKPYVAFIDGVTLGGGLGVSVHGSHRIATERTLFAVPEAAIGLIPDVGASYVLPRLPGESGSYLGLTGARINTADVVALGIATHCVPSVRLNDLLDDLVRADWSGDAHGIVDEIIGLYAVDSGVPYLAAHSRVIEHCFAHDDIAAILEALDGAGCAVTAEAAAMIRTMSPTSLKLTLAANRRGRRLSFDDCMVMEYRLIQSILLHSDFYEGVRALLIDKDRGPRWDPPVLESVDEAKVARYFVAPPTGDLTFVD